MSGEPQTEAGRAYLAKLNGSHDDIRRAAILAIEAEAIAQEREGLAAAVHASPLARCTGEQDEQDRRDGLTPWCERFAASLQGADR